MVLLVTVLEKSEAMNIFTWGATVVPLVVFLFEALAAKILTPKDRLQRGWLTVTRPCRMQNTCIVD